MQNIVAVIFKVESEGYQAITELRNQPVVDQTTILQMALVKRTEQGLKVCDRFDSGIHTTDDMLVGGLVGSLVGILGGPLGVILMGSYGMLAGSLIDSGDAAMSEVLLETVAAKLIEGEIALIGLVDEADENCLDARLAKFENEIARFDAAVIAEEVEEAIEIQKDMEHQARARLRKEKSEERKKKIEEKRAKMAAKFENFKNSFKKKDKKEPAEDGGKAEA